MKDTKLFSCFADFWQLTQDLDDFQFKKIIKSLPEEEQDFLLIDMKRGQWEDLIIRNRVDKLIDAIRIEDKVDLLDIRRKVIKGKSQYLDKKVWDKFITALFDISEDSRHFNYVIGNIKAYQEGDVIFLVLGDAKERYGSKD